MRRLIIIALTTICLMCGIVGVDATTNAIRSNGLDFWNYFGESASLDSVNEKARDLDRVREEQMQRSESTNYVAVSLCNGQITISDAIDSIQTLVQNSSYKDIDLRTCYIITGYLRSDATERDTYACFLLLTIRSLQAAAKISGDETSAAFFSDHLSHIFKEAEAQSQGLLPTILDPLH